MALRASAKPGIMCHNFGLLKGIQVADNVAGGCCIVQVDNPCRHIRGKSVPHQRSKEDVAEQRSYDYAKQV